MRLFCVHLEKKRTSVGGLTLLEMLISLAIMAVVFAAIIPQFRSVQNSWDLRQGRAEALQNGRVLIDHLDRNLAQATKIIAVSNSGVANGFIEFESIDKKTYRYEVSGGRNVQFGEVGKLADLAGPVSQFQFACYRLDDFVKPTTKAEDVRLINVSTVIANSAGLGHDESLTSSVFLKIHGSAGITSYTPMRFSTFTGIQADICQIDADHYLVAYSDGLRGWAVVLTVDDSDWSISKSVNLRFENSFLMFPSLVEIDKSHYLCAYTGPGFGGYCVVLTVNKSGWTITKESEFQFDSKVGLYPAVEAVDNDSFLCAYTGDGFQGVAAILSVKKPDYEITKDISAVFESGNALYPSLSEIKTKTFLCAYTGPNNDGYANVLTSKNKNDLTVWNRFKFDGSAGLGPVVIQADKGRHVCAYQGPGSDGWSAIMNVDTKTLDITKGSTLDFDTGTGSQPALCLLKDMDFLCVYEGPGFLSKEGRATVLSVSKNSYDISAPLAMYQYSDTASSPALCSIDDSHAICVYTGAGAGGMAVVFEASGSVSP
jgi:type II secretory pathway pseudopilin PulG